MNRPPGGDGGGPDVVKEGDEARKAVAEAGRRTSSRRELSRHPNFDEVSPEVGELDEDAFERAMDEDPDAALALLADLTGATDERLRALARELAGRVIVDVAQVGAPRRRGVGRMHTQRAARTPGDLDVDASLDTVLEARGERRPPNIDDLTVRSWQRPDTALCLLVDRSGSMLGERLAAAAVAAAAVAYRNAADCSVVAFGDEAIVLKSQDVPRSADELVGDLLRLRGHGTTDVGLAVRTAALQLSRSNAGRKVAVLLSDCRPTTGGDPTADAARLEELAIVAPAADLADAEALARAVGARCVALAGPAQVPEAIAAALLG